LQKFANYEGACIYKVVFMGSISEFCGVVIKEEINQEDTWKVRTGVMLYPKALSITALNGEVRLGHISFSSPCTESDFKLAWDERPDMVDSAHRVITLVESHFSDTNVSNYYLAWKFENPAHSSQVKYFRVLRK
jgi:hypothetical protein